MGFKKIIDGFSRIFVGGLFVFSGLIKLNDPVGTEIKLEEYFSVFAEDGLTFFKWFIPFSLELGLIMIVLEVVLGVAVLLHYRMKYTTKALLGLILFFTALTFYSAYFNKVTDCGCFGDAIKLTPWQSFLKDIVLLVFILHLFWYRRGYIPQLRTTEGHVSIGGVTVLSFFLGVYAVRHLPFIDFRAYKVGNNIPEQMQPKEQAIFEYTFTDKEGKEIQSTKYLSDTLLYTYKGIRQLNEEATIPKIRDYAVTGLDGEDYTQLTFTGTKLLLVIQDVQKASRKNMGKIAALAKGLEGRVDVLLLTSSSSEDVEPFRHEYQLAVPYYLVDATVLKTMLRSNPGLTLWVDGTVKGMWHHNDTPTGEEVVSLIK